jgi:SAM-dependent methyltransferase
MFRQATKTIAQQIPAIGRLIKQRDETLIEVERLRDQLGRESATFEFGGFRRLSPVTENWGHARGQPVDGAYIERFLSQHRADIRGDVLEIRNNHYTLRFGEGRVRKSVIADVSADNGKATVIADLVDARQIPDCAFDCVILTKVLELIFDFGAALRTVSRILKPGGVALITVSSTSQMGADATEPAALSWSFYPRSFAIFSSNILIPKSSPLSPMATSKPRSASSPASLERILRQTILRTMIPAILSSWRPAASSRARLRGFRP